jgi:endonuclease YncB( thermonuclease family)
MIFFARLSAVAVLATAVSFGAASALAQDATVAGAAAAIDGDTLIVDGTTARLMGIDAAEAEQTCSEWHGNIQREYPCGAQATAFLQSLVAGREVSCVARGTAPEDAILGVCYAAGIDLAEAIANAGWGVALRDQSVRYVAASDAARLAQRGLWAGKFDEPAAWRASRGSD